MTFPDDRRVLVGHGKRCLPARCRLSSLAPGHLRRRRTRRRRGGRNARNGRGGGCALAVKVSAALNGNKSNDSPHSPSSGGGRWAGDRRRMVAADKRAIGHFQREFQGPVLVEIQTILAGGVFDSRSKNFRAPAARS